MTHDFDVDEKALEYAVRSILSVHIQYGRSYMNRL